MESVLNAPKKGRRTARDRRAAGAISTPAAGTAEVPLIVFDPRIHSGWPLSVDPATAIVAPTLRQYLSFRIGTDTYAVRIEQLREIIEFRSVTEVPMTPEFCRGVINLRGVVVPVIDLSQRLGRGATPVQRRTCILIVELPSEQGTVVVGVLVSGSRTVIAALPSPLDRQEFEAMRNEIAEFQPRGSVLAAEFIEDMITVEGRPQMALNLQQALEPHTLSLLIGNTSRAAYGPGFER